jgi:hypothetical protein
MQAFLDQLADAAPPELLDVHLERELGHDHQRPDRNAVVPCPTRLGPASDCDGFLLDAVHRAGAAELSVLMVKFCEPHYFYYPRIKSTFEEAGVPHLLLETEHDNMRTRVEAFVETIRRRQYVTGSGARPA